MNRRTVLVVDDQFVNRSILAKLLESDYRIMQAADGKEALDCLYKNSEVISAVLLDIIMPVMDGYQVLEEMKQDSVLSKIPVIVTTMKEGEDAEIRALGLGAQDFVSKPYKANVIRQRLKNTIKLRETAAIVNRVDRDELTGLYNKQFFIKHVEDYMTANPDGEYDILCLGIERFKLVNDIYGMHKGDDMLCHIAECVRGVGNGKNISGRFIGDSFYSFMQRQPAYTEAMFTALQKKVNEYPIDMDVKIHCGIYQIQDTSASVNSMCDWAHMAAETNRGKYASSFSIYDDKIRQKLLEEQFITNTMEKAIEERQFQVYYQPKYDLHNESIVGVEALVRWNHPDRGFLSPGAFIPLFEKNGFIVQLDEYVWDTACRDIRSWIDGGYPPVPVSVNVSRADVYNPKLIDILTGLVDQYDIPVSYLHLEITESAYTDNPDQIIDVVSRLRDMGFIIEMDDFGSGYSSLNMLAEMPVDILKLDMKFIQMETAKTSGKGILSFVISLAKWMNLYVVAEGVETADQIASLRSMDCNFVQGFYYAKPMAKSDFDVLLRTNAVNEVDTFEEKAPGSEGQTEDKAKKEKNGHMLIVDDIAINRAVLVSIFEDEYDIAECENGQVAWEYLEQHYMEMDIVLLDLLMPVMDGFQLLSKIRQDIRTSDIPVIVTSQGDAETEEKALNMKADDFISKPYYGKIVQSRVKNVLAAHRAMELQPVDTENANKKVESLVDSLKEQVRYRYILDNLDVAFFELGSDGSFYASDKYSLYAMSDEAPGSIYNNETAYEVVYPDDIPMVFKFAEERNRNLSRASATLRLKMKDGSYRWTEMIGFYDYDINGKRVKSVGVLKDVDKEWLQQNRKLQDALQAAESANHAKTDFLARVSHDMRTPLHGILGMTSLMKGKVKSEEFKTDLIYLENSGKYLLNLIDDTLDVGKIESGNIELHPVVCDGRTAFNTVIAMVKPNIQAKDIDFSVHVENLPFTKLYLDVGRAQQVALNILSNAVKFTPKGGKIEFIMENLSVKDGVITDRIIIRDSGIGMSEEFQKTLFEPFTQEHSDSRTMYSGTGLGLTIAKECIDLMGGSISVKSRKNEGTEFTIILPMHQATKEQIKEWEACSIENTEDYNLEGRRILLCEDHPLNAEIAIRLLKQQGMLAEHAKNGKIGLDMFRKSPEGYYDAVLMDIRMPMMDGLEATREIRKLPRTDAQIIPIIAMTANVMIDDFNNSLNAGMTEHLGKPVEPAKLYRTLADLISAPHPHEGRKVMVVDDIEMNRRMVKKAVSSAYDVVEASNGMEALEILDKETDIAAVVTDIQMPVMDGKELITRIREDSRFDNVAILANTIYGDHRQEDELLILGANDFVYKPASPRVIMMRLEHILRRM